MKFLQFGDEIYDFIFAEFNFCNTLRAKKINLLFRSGRGTYIIHNLDIQMHLYLIKHMYTQVSTKSISSKQLYQYVTHNSRWECQSVLEPYIT